MFADWRTGLDFIPLLTFFLLILIFFISGIFSGYKKALYYGIFNVIFFLIGWIITIELGDRIINWILSFFTIDQSVITNDEIVQLVKPFLGIILYFIFAFFGYLLIGLPLYHLIFAKLFRMGKYDKKSKKYLEYCKKHNIKPEIYTKKDYKKYRVLSRSFGGIFSLLLNVQNICITTELAYVGSTQSITIKSNKLQQSIFNLTNSFNNLFTGYTNNLYEDASSAIAALQLLQNDPDTGTPLYNCLFTPIQDLINGVTKYVNAPIFTLEQVTSIENLFNNFQFSQEEKLTKITLIYFYFILYHYYKPLMYYYTSYFKFFYYWDYQVKKMLTYFWEVLENSKIYIHSYQGWFHTRGYLYKTYKTYYQKYKIVFTNI